jgi:branched-chain amino acid aminotransferase
MGYKGPGPAKSLLDTAPHRSTGSGNTYLDGLYMDNFPITKVDASRRASVDYDNLGFGDYFSDHMFSMVYEDGTWRDHQIMPYGPIPMPPGMGSLHYSQSVFEGLKAFRGTDDRVRVFRPDMNARRLSRSCERLCLPQVDEATFMTAVNELVRLDQDWIPNRRGEALYLRPLLFGTEAHLEVRPSSTYRFLIMTSPVRAYYGDKSSPVSLQVQDSYTRAAPGGVGEAKTGGNYAASLLPGERSRADGFNQALWLDGVEHRYVEEVGQMNIFFRFGDTVVTPALLGTILPGVTRDSVLALLRDAGMKVEERRIDIAEVIDGAKSGALTEAFGAGTAAVIAPVGRLAVRGEVLDINGFQQGDLTQSLYDQITAIQYGDTNDAHQWNMIIDGAGPVVAAAAE